MCFLKPSLNLSIDSSFSVKSLAGSIFRSSICFIVAWLLGSKILIESIELSKKSILTGLSLLAG